MSDQTKESEKLTGRERSLANLKKFKPGKSGNPGGKPKSGKRRARSMTLALRDAIEEDKTAKGLPRRLLDECVKAAKKGDFRFIEMLWNRMDGAVTIELRVTKEVESRIDAYLEIAHQLLPREYYRPLVNAWADYDEQSRNASTSASTIEERTH